MGAGVRAAPIAQPVQTAPPASTVMLAALVGFVPGLLKLKPQPGKTSLPPQPSARPPQKRAAAVPAPAVRVDTAGSMEAKQ